MSRKWGRIIENLAWTGSLIGMGMSLLQAPAHADMGRWERGGGFHHMPREGAWQGGSAIPEMGPGWIRVPVGAYQYGNSLLSLRPLLRLDRSYEGRAIESVIVNASAIAGGEMTLDLDAHQAGGALNLIPIARDYTFVLNPMRDRVGVDFEELTLNLRGTILVNWVEVKFRDGAAPMPYPAPRPPMPGPGPMPVPRPVPPVYAPIGNNITVSVRQTFDGRIPVDLLSLFDLRRVGVFGKKIRSIQILGYADGIYSYISLLANGAPVGNTGGIYAMTVLGSHELYAENPICVDGNLSELGLLVTGRVYIDSMTLSFAP